MSPTGGIFMVVVTLSSYIEGREQRVPSAPQNLEVIQYNATAYRVSWLPPEHPNGQIFGYYVYQDKLTDGVPIANGRKKAAMLMDKSINGTLISDFEPNTEYVLRVNAFNENGDGEYASSNHFITGRSPPQPPRPQSVSLVDENPPLRARVEWLPAVDKGDGSAAPVQQYLVWYRPADSHSGWLKVEVNGDERGVLLDNLLMGTECELSTQYPLFASFNRRRLDEIQMASFNQDGFSENVTERLTTPVGRPSGIPLNIQYSINEDKAFFQWDAPEAGKRNGPIISYHPVLSCNDNSPPKHQNVTRQWTTFTIDPKKSYGFQVAANTAKGPGPYSEQIRVRPSDSGWSYRYNIRNKEGLDVIQLNTMQIQVI